MKFLIPVLTVLFSLNFFVAGTAHAVSCEARCFISCRDILFEEIENQFSSQKCSDYGGNAHGTGASYKCVKYVNGSQTVYGYGTLTYEAQQAAYQACQSASVPCSRLLDTPSKSVGGYSCN